MFFDCFSYGRFLSNSSVTAKQAMIKTAMPATAGMKYCSTILVCGGCVGAWVGAGGSTVKLVSEYDGQ